MEKMTCVILITSFSRSSVGIQEKVTYASTARETSQHTTSLKPSCILDYIDSACTKIHDIPIQHSK
ncbi:hypothetical protein F511_04906 [Dorcoceras hygrometricum]|uniref:Uncharacterized protein n=1 Tax=Dorcoceras hygrometricum TaxID=472368 RepID=A0A2Z7BJY9_9LAMI|nr:hypothetical protein F511_04906 [Dorcoceras hygrometricum]